MGGEQASTVRQQSAGQICALCGIAGDYAANRNNTLIVSPDNASRREINDAVHHESQARGMVNVQDHSLRVLVPRQELTRAERQWAPCRNRAT
jgi:TPP-dependent 2-oxoacid decarboxylase